ncbi:MAG: helix-hairpin-helix domain-containing protein, partial [Gallicola sp.]|nr:helix-hairpin-helix domain-containing protein [Gallicola sp.]
QSLPNIGPKKAEAIIQYRQENGSFQSIEEITQVSGIGEKTFAQLQDLITLGQP